MSYTPFSLQTLIKALPFEDSQQATQSSGGGSRLFGGRESNRAGAGSRLTSSIGWGNKDSQVTVESVEAWENNLYIGTSDGQLIHYLLDDQVLSKDNIPSNFLISKQALSWKRKVERIMLLPQINTAVILCESTLSFYSLPEMTALPTTNFPWIKGVTCFCHDTSKEGKLERDGSVKLCVMKKRTLHIYSLTDRYSEETPMQVPDGAITACQYGPYIFVADLHQYKIINLSTKRMEIVQPYLSDIGDSFNPIVTVIRAGEFLLTIPTTNQMTFGQFISSTGEAIRGIIQWEGLPRAISVEFPYVVALLRNNTIEIHDITELKLVQREVLSSKSKTISTGPGIKVQVAGLIDKLKLESGYLLNEDNSSSQLDNNTSSEVDGLQILTGSSSNQSNFLATIPTRLIIAGSESVVALAATPLIVQADSMLDSSARIDEAVELARQAMKTSTPDNVHSEIMRHESNYILQKSGFLYLGETLFEMAFPLFEEGGIDPRLLIQLFGNLREIICYDNNFTVYSGVKTIIKRLGAIDDIVSRSLVKNYDPHIKPDLESSHATKELRKVLIKNAKEMLQKFLTKYREQRRDKGKTLKPDKRNILRAVDNALLRLYAESNSEQLNSLLENSNECVLELSEKILFDNKKYYPLALLYKDNKEYKKALELWKKIFEEDHPDKDGPNCLKQMANLLRKLDDHDMVLEYANWITKHDEVIGAQIFIQPNLRRSLLIEPSLVLDQLRTVGKNGLKLYLEYLVIQRKSQEEQHHTELALLYVEELETILQSNEAKVQIETMTNEFIKNPNDSAKTYLSFLLNQSKEDLLSQGRATLITFLQSSTRYNAKLILNKLLEIQILKAELAVVYGKLDDHEKALHILVDDLRDYRGAEFYCLYAGRMIGIISAKKQSDNKSMEDKDLISTRRTLFLMLLKVYLQNGNEIIEKIINLLNTHAVYLDTNEVMELLPEFWSVEMLNEFLIRSLRQNYHEYREGQILKGLCRGENTMTSFELYQAYQAIGPIVINQNVSCSICKEYISGSDFMRQPNNDIVHANCNNSEHRESNTAVSDPLSNQT